MRAWLRSVLEFPLTVVLLVIAAVVGLTQPFLDGPPLRSDGLGYHYWMHAFARGDLHFCDLVPPGEGDPVGAIFPVAPDADGRPKCQNKYPPGVALFRWPFMAAYVRATPGPVRVTHVENNMSVLSALVALGLTAGFVLATLSRLRVRAAVADFAFVTATLGVGLFHYATFDGSFSHVYSALGVASLGWLLMGRETLSPGHVVLSGVVAAWLILVRNTNGLFIVAAVPLLWRAKAAVASLLLGAGTGSAVQFAYNHYATGTFTLSSYGAETFNWSQSHWLDVLFSGECGLFSYYPVFGIALVLGLLRPRPRTGALALTAVVAAFAALYGAWHSWQLGAGFGHRGFVECSPLVALLLGVGLSERPKAAWPAAGAASLTTVLMWGYWQHVIPFDGASWATSAESLVRTPSWLWSALVLLMAVGLRRVKRVTRAGE